MATEPLQWLRFEMTLSEVEPAELAHDLIQSLYSSRDDGVEDAWDLFSMLRHRSVLVCKHSSRRTPR
jgi:hypothetical protein